MTQEGNEVETTGEQEAQAPTPEEQLKALQTQVEILTLEKGESDKSYKGLQRVLTQKDNEFKKQGDIDSRINGLQDTLEILATAVATGKNAEDIDPEQRQDVVALLKKQRAEQETKRKQDESQRSQQDYATQADTVYAEAQELLKDSDDPEQLIEIKDFLIDGKIDRAKARLGKIKGKAPSQSKEPEEQRIERLAEEKSVAKLKERGLLEEFPSQPSARSSSWAETERKYAEGEIDTMEYSKARAKEGIS